VFGVTREIKKKFKEKSSIFEEKNRFFYFLLLSGNPWGSSKNVSPFGPSAWRAIAKDYKARKVISEVYTSFVLQCTVSGR